VHRGAVQRSLCLLLLTHVRTRVWLRACWATRCYRVRVRVRGVGRPYAAKKRRGKAQEKTGKQFGYAAALRINVRVCACVRAADYSGTLGKASAHKKQSEQSKR
jgi:hypothetical protein